ncbi:hypothetical protein ACYVVD_02660 [Arenicellales bacterium IMCC58067]
MNYFKALVAIAVYVAVLVPIYYVHSQYGKVDVVFYAALFDAALAVAVTTVILFLLPYFSNFSIFEKLLLTTVFVLSGYILAISVPTVIDRSLSFYILEKLQQRGGGVRLDKFNYIFTNEYMREHRLVDVRLTEQEASGTISIDGDCVNLTKKGATIASVGQYFRRNILPKKRLLRGEYTDALTDPFQSSDILVDYLCD